MACTFCASSGKLGVAIGRENERLPRTESASVDELAIAAGIVSLTSACKFSNALINSRFLKMEYNLSRVTRATVFMVGVLAICAPGEKRLNLNLQAGKREMRVAGAPEFLDAPMLHMALIAPRKALIALTLPAC